VNGGFTAINGVKDDKGVDFKVGKVEIGIYRVKADKEVD
jgi:hypothetical protein